MAKYCGGCGSPLDDSSKVCVNCGRPNPHYKGLNRLRARADGAGGTKGGLVIYALIAVAVVAVIVAAASLAVANTGYRGMLKDYVNALVNVDGEKAARLISPSFLEAAGVDVEAYAGSLDARFESNMGTIEELIGKDVKVKRVAVTDFDRMDKDDFEEMIDELDDEDYDTRKIKAIAEVEAAVRLKGAKKTRDFEIEFIMFKEGGRWRIVNASGLYKD